MRNPFEDGGLVDKVMPWAGLVISATLLYNGVSEYRHGASAGWPATATLMVILNLYAIYRQFRPRNRA